MSPRRSAPSGGEPAAGAARPGEAERFDPARDGPDLAYEHVHRYALAARVCAGLSVLDLASGSGFGGAILRGAGARVVALDCERTVLAAQRPAVRADAARLPFRDASFEAVVCFEAIEHLRDPSALLDEVVRVLGGPQILLLSTPDREIYSRRAGHRNPHHHSELARGELRGLLEQRFRSVELFGQSLWAGSWIARLDEATGAGSDRPRSLAALPDPTAAGGGRPRTPAPWAEAGDAALPVPLYLLAACANAEPGARALRERLPSDSILHDPHQWLIGQYDCAQRASVHHEAELAAARRASANLEGQIAAARAHVADLETQVARARDASEDQRSQLRAARSAVVDLEGQLEAARAAVEDCLGQIDRARDAVTYYEHRTAANDARIAELEGELARARTGGADRGAPPERRLARIATRLRGWLHGRSERPG